MKKLNQQARRRSQKRSKYALSRTVKSRAFKLRRALFHRLPLKIRRMFVPITYLPHPVYKGIPRGQSSTIDREHRAIAKNRVTGAAAKRFFTSPIRGW